MLPTVHLQILRAFRYHEYFHVILKVISLLWLTINNNNPTSIILISHTENLARRLQHFRYLSTKLISYRRTRSFVNEIFLGM